MKSTPKSPSGTKWSSEWASVPYWGGGEVPSFFLLKCAHLITLLLTHHTLPPIHPNLPRFDLHLEKRRFDNFHFVEFNYVKIVAKKFKMPSFEETFALMALSEVPQQFLDCKGLGYVK